MSDYRVVLMAYPSSYRSENGSEMTDTVNELTDGRWSIRQSASLAVGGLRTRTLQATHGSSRAVWESGARLGLLIWLVMLSSWDIAAPIWLNPSVVPSWAGLLPLAAILAMMVSTRWWVAVLVTGIWVLPLWAYATSPFLHSASYFQVALPLAGAVGVAWWLAVATDGRRALGPAAGVSLVIAAKVVSPFVAASIGPEPVLFLTLAVVVVGGLIASTVDPRVVTTGAVYASLYLPLIFALSRNSDRWILLLVFSIAIALAAATS
jgi:hypothetical protein